MRSQGTASQAEGATGTNAPRQVTWAGASVAGGVGEVGQAEEGDSGHITEGFGFLEKELDLF